MLWAGCAGIWQNTISPKHSIEFHLRLQVEEVCAMLDRANGELNVYFQSRAARVVFVFNFSNLNIGKETLFAAEIFQKHHDYI